MKENSQNQREHNSLTLSSL